MRYDEHIDAVEVEVDALHAAVASGPVTADVPTCDGWTVADLVEHVGGFCGFWTHVLCEGTGRQKTPFPDLPQGEALAPWWREVGALFVDELRATPADAAVWSWYEPDRTAAFVARRSANELAVHRFDAQSAGGACTPIAAELAADGIDELLDRLVAVRDRTGDATGQTLGLRATGDGDGAGWLVTLRPDRVDVARTWSEADLELRGSASDLELLLYRRPPLGPVEQAGDASALTAWYREFRF